MSPFVVPTVYVDFAPTAEETQLVAAWSTERGLRLRTATPWDAPTLTSDPGLAGAIEEELARAREALLGLDLSLAKRAQDQGETLILAHPELPQAAFLRAEWYRVEAVRLRLRDPGDDSGAHAAATAAVLLDGGRALGIGEEPPDPVGSIEQRTLRTDARVPEGTQLWLDGRPLPRATPSSNGATKLPWPPGPHHVRISIEGRTVAALWVEPRKLQPAGDVVVAWPKPPACSEPALVAALAGANPGTCDDFFAVRRSNVGGGSATHGATPGLYISRCNAFGCGRAQAIQHRARAPQRDASPAWIPWFFVGVTAAATTMIALSAAGAFSPASAPVPFFRNGGVQVEARP